MNLPVASALVSCSVSCMAALVALLVGRLAGWREVVRFGWVALTAGLAVGSDAANTFDAPASAFVWGGRAEILFLALHGVAWHAYLSAWDRRAPPRWVAAAQAGLLGLAPLALWPGAFYGGAVVARRVGWLGVTYHDVQLGPTGPVFMTLLLAGAASVVVRLAGLVRRGVPGARLQLGAAGLLLAFVLHDAALAAAGSWPGPYLLDLGFAPIIAVLALTVARKAALESRELRRLQASLERLVVDRTRDLTAAQAELVRRERLVALGQFAAELAHQLNSPTAVVASNLRYLREEAPGLGLDGEGRAALEDALQAAGRLAEVTRQLVNAGRLAGSERGRPRPVDVGSALREALRAAEARAGRPGVRVALEVPPGLAVMAEEEVVVQVATHLLVNALQAFPPGRADGRVEVRAEADGEQVTLTVEDDGPGIAPAVQQRLFEPFCTTKPSGVGSGLGLFVSRQMLAGVGGEIAVCSAVGAGTCARVRLARAPAPLPADLPAAGPEPAGPPPDPGVRAPRPAEA